MVKLQNIIIVVIFFLCVHISFSETSAELEKKTVPTHADAAVVFVKYSGLFDRYVSRDATLNDCVSFLNQHGVYLGLMEVVNGSEFTIKDCARVMGQIELLLMSEAEYLAGKIVLPKDVDSWEEFCDLEGVEYAKGYEAIVQALGVAAQVDH